MESPLNAREFLKRFHLPQLVRIHQVDLHQQQASFDTTGGAEFEKRQCAARKSNLSPGHSNTSISSSFIAIEGTKLASNAHLNASSEWNYVGGLHACADRDANINESLPDFSRAHKDQDDHDSDGNRRELGQGFRSLSAWSSVQVDRMLNQSRDPLSDERCFVRVPRASLIQQPPRDKLDKQARQSSGSSRKSVEFLRANTCNADRSKRSSVSLNYEHQDKLNPLQRMKLVPPCKSSTLAKLELNQPFLLYKAYKKIELCAYAIDQKNQLNDKSGDPIYFPHNYQGKFAARCEASAKNRKILWKLEQLVVQQPALSSAGHSSKMAGQLISAASQQVSCH